MDHRSATIRAGDLRHKLTLHAPSGTYGAGSPVDLATGIPAKITGPSSQAREQLAAGGLQGQTVYTVTIRYRDDVQMDRTLEEECCTHRVFQIVSMVPTDRMEALELTCIVGER